MLRRHSQFLKSLLFLFDLGVICTCWVGAYFLRFSELLEPAPKGIPPIQTYLWMLAPIVVVWGISFQAFDLYRPRRMGTRLGEFLDVAKANTLSVLILVALTFFIRQYEFSRLVLVYFWILNLAALGFSRMLFRETLRFLRRQGFNQRHALIVGAGRLGCRAAEALARHPELGVKVRGFLSVDYSRRGERIEGIPHLGTYDDLRARIDEGIDIVFVCLPPQEEQWAEKVFAVLSATTVEVKALPAICEFMSLRAEAEMFEGLPIITLQGSPLYGWNLVIKRVMDVIGAVAALILFAPVLLAVSALVKVTSPGPVLFRQERMGLDGQAFQMLKFRSMRIDAESETGPVWAQPNDDRRTPIGAFLRRTSLDELPQFWNVLKGEMSLVGPRPERPELIDEFKHRIPHYNARHHAKPGMTGWAQVNGLRGDTDLGERIQCDLWYLENWSLWLDLQIMLLTFFKRDNAY